MTAFFIDADNLCAAAWVEEAFRLLEASEGPVTVRRAYGSADTLKGLGEVMRYRLIRPYQNLSLTKNTTDVALAVDVMELSYATPRPAAIVIGSGDADFVPLVLRLRERGFRVVCVSERGKMASEAIEAYDHVMLVGASAAREAVVRSGEALAATEEVEPKPPRKAPAKKAVAKKVPAAKKVPGAKKVPAAKAPAAPASAKKTAVKKAAAPAPTMAPVAPEPVPKMVFVAPKPVPKIAFVGAEPVTVQLILDHAPALQSGERQPFSDIVRQLREAKLMGKHATSVKLFKKFPDAFELWPDDRPSAVRYMPPAH